MAVLIEKIDFSFVCFTTNFVAFFFKLKMISVAWFTNVVELKAFTSWGKFYHNEFVVLLQFLGFYKKSCLSLVMKTTLENWCGNVVMKSWLVVPRSVQDNFHFSIGCINLFCVLCISKVKHQNFSLITCIRTRSINLFCVLCISKTKHQNSSLIASIHTFVFLLIVSFWAF